MQPDPDNSRLILFYKGDISALMLFCQQADGSICFPTLPTLSSIAGDEQKKDQSVVPHPAQIIKTINAELKLDEDLLVAEPGFHEQVDTPDGIVSVHLARFRLLDPPHQLMAVRQCKMQPLTALRGRPPAEMELLRKAYIQVMEG